MIATHSIDGDAEPLVWLHIQLNGIDDLSCGRNPNAMKYVIASGNLFSLLVFACFNNLLATIKTIRRDAMTGVRLTRGLVYRQSGRSQTIV